MTEIDKVDVIAWVEWVDSGIAATGWEHLDEVIAETEKTAEPLVSVGFVLQDDSRGMLIAGGLNRSHSDVNLAMFIPRSAIRSVRTWMPGGSSS